MKECTCPPAPNTKVDGNCPVHTEDPSVWVDPKDWS